MKFDTKEIFVFNCKKLLKKECKENDSLVKEYWYKIEYLYYDRNHDIQYSFEFVEPDVYQNIHLQDLIALLNGDKLRGYYQQYKFKAVELVE